MGDEKIQGESLKEYSLIIEVTWATQSLGVRPYV